MEKVHKVTILLDEGESRFTRLINDGGMEDKIVSFEPSSFKKAARALTRAALEMWAAIENCGVEMKEE